MSHFYENIKNTTINDNQEIKKILHLFTKEKSFYFHYSYDTLFNFFNYFFRSLKLKSNYIDLNDYFESSTFSQYPREQLLKTYELILSLYQQYTLYIQNQLEYGEKHQITQLFKDIFDLIETNLSFLNLCKKEIDDKELGKIVIIIPKDIKLDITLNSLDKDIQTQLIVYNARNLAGNIREKEKILSYLAKENEGLIKEKKKPGNLYDHLGFLCNNLDIRHGNKDKPANTNPTKYYLLTKKDREIWLDRTYRLFVELYYIETLNEDYLAIQKLKEK